MKIIIIQEIYDGGHILFLFQENFCKLFSHVESVRSFFFKYSRIGNIAENFQDMASSLRILDNL